MLKQLLFTFSLDLLDKGYWFFYVANLWKIRVELFFNRHQGQPLRDPSSTRNHIVFTYNDFVKVTTCGFDVAQSSS